MAEEELGPGDADSGDSPSPSSHTSHTESEPSTSTFHRNGTSSTDDPPIKKPRKSDSTKIVQVANIAPQTTKEQMQTLFALLGKVDDIRLYPTMDIGITITSKICFVKFYDTASVGIAQHLTNTVFIDRALVVIPYMDGEIPDEQRGIELLSSGTLLPGIADPKLPQHVTSQLEGIPPNQVVATLDPKLVEAKLPLYPVLPNTYDTRKIEEIRRTIMVANIDPEVKSTYVVDYFNQAGEVKYYRPCTRDNDPLVYALVEFTEQPSVLDALKMNGVKIGNKHIKVYHATQAIIKPQAKTNEAAQKEIEDAMSRQAQTILSQGLDVSSAAAHTVPPKEKRRSRSRNRTRSRERRRSRSRSATRRSRSPRRRSSSRSRRVDYHSRRTTRSGSKDRVSRRTGRSRSRDRDYKSHRSRSRSGRSHSRSSRHEDKKKSSSSRKHKDKKRERERDEKKDRDKDRDRDRDDKKDRDRDRDRDRKDKDRDRDREDRKRDKDKERYKEKSSNSKEVREKEREESHENGVEKMEIDD